MAGYAKGTGVGLLAIHPSMQVEDATELMAEAAKLFAKRAVPSRKLTNRSSNASVISFYQKLGFHVEDGLCSENV